MAPMVISRGCVRMRKSLCERERCDKCVRVAAWDRAYTKGRWWKIHSRVREGVRSLAYARGWEIAGVYYFQPMSIRAAATRG